MQEDAKVFSSDITRGQKPLQNNLHGLLNVEPATPIAGNVHKEFSCDFQPKNDKYYSPTKRNRLKVKTVRDIRCLFEEDICSYLPDDLGKQQNILLRRITGGSSRDENTITVAKNLLRSENPITRSAWQMIMNLNPERKANCTQFVLWNGKRIRVNGSKGGRNKFLCNYDLCSQKRPLRNKTFPKNNNNKRGLLRNSLAIKFKPGPLTKKKFLDDSYQKYSVGRINLINLPKPGLDIEPTYGVILEPEITNILQNICDINGRISKKWAEFSVSVLGTLKNKEAVQNNTETSVTFELNYKCNQRRILMRQDIDSTFNKGDKIDCRPHEHFYEHFDILPEVINVLSNILDCVEISLRQDQLYSGEDEPRECSDNSSYATVSTHLKDRAKRKNNELGRLDVTIIQLSEDPQEESIEICQKSHCSLGCICASLKCALKLKEHCGHMECMFGCKCDFSKYKLNYSFERNCSELIPSLLNLNNEIHLRLAKEEQKFHQTVVMTGNKSILLKSQKRNCKASKRHADFYSDMCLKTESKTKAILCIVDLNLDFENIEPLCMVHMLYKCFCKGRFTHNSMSDAFVRTGVNETIAHEKVTYASVSEDTEIKTKTIYRSRMRTEKNKTISKKYSGSECTDAISDVHFESKCARVNPYKGRKYYDSYYFSTNRRIFEMEKNDNKLHERMMTLVNKSESSDICKLLNESFHDYEYLPSENYNSLHLQNQSPALIDNPAVCDSLSIREVNFEAESTAVAVTTGSQQKFITDETHVSAYTKDKSIAITKSKRKYMQDENKFIDDISQDKSNAVTKSKLKCLPGGTNLNNYNYQDESTELQVTSICFTNDNSQNIATNVTNNSQNIATNVTISTQKCLSDRTSLSADNSQDTSTIVIRSTPKCSPIRTKMMTNWLATNYKLHKKRVEQGIVKKALDPPTQGKMSLYTWEFVLSRYRERMNLFMVSKEQPFRIFVAVHIKHPFFDNCLNIDDIRFADLQSYPITVINLLTNATASKDDFVILCGLTHCWEIVGSVTKISETKGSESDIIRPITKISDLNSSEIQSDTNSNTMPTYYDEEIIPINIIPNDTVLPLQETRDRPACETEVSTDSSKWFVMTVENDFSEIQFYKRGFFVKHASIIKAINVARMTKKTVRLSSLKCVEPNSGPQFGIYAIPSTNECCVFIGPYDKDEQLGIETVKSMFDARKHERTRGVWITTQKVDNVKVIDNPLSFMPPNDLHHSRIIYLESDYIPTASNSCDVSTSKDTFDESRHLNTPKTRGSKLVKPIKIRKTNGFYHLASKGLLKLQQSQPRQNPEHKGIVNEAPIKIKSLLRNSVTISSNALPYHLSTVIGSPPPLMKMSTPSSSVTYHNKSVEPSLFNIENKKPVAEIAPQIKIVGIYSESGAALEYDNVEVENPERGMLILKPEEINKRLIQNQTTEHLLSTNYSIDVNMDLDIENFLATSQVCTLPNADIYVVSDEEEASKTIVYRDVWIESRTIDNLGWIRGRRNQENDISFEFPGFKYTEFYKEDEAFAKINQVLSRKVYVPKTLTLEWYVVESEDELKSSQMLNPEQLGVDYVLTKRGICHKRELRTSISSKASLNRNVRRALPDPGAVWSLLAPAREGMKSTEKDNDKMVFISELEEQSRTLEIEGDTLLKGKRGEVLKSLCSVTDEKREHVTETLQNIMSPVVSSDETDC